MISVQGAGCRVQGDPPASATRVQLQRRIQQFGKAGGREFARGKNELGDYGLPLGSARGEFRR